MDEEEGMKLVAQVFTSDKEITVTLPLRELWLIVSALQLQVTHPSLHETIQALAEGIGRKLCALVVEELPQMAELLEMGWHREYDYIEQDDPEAPYGFYDDTDDIPW